MATAPKAGSVAARVAAKNSAAKASASTAKPSSTSASGSTSGSASSGSSSGSLPTYTIKNAKTGQTVTFSNVNSLTPAQKLAVSNAYKSGAVAIQAGSQNTDVGGYDVGFNTDKQVVTYTNPTTGKSISVTDVNALSPSEKAWVNTAIKNNWNKTVGSVSADNSWKIGATPATTVNVNAKPGQQTIVNANNPVGKQLSASQKKVLIDKYNSFDTKEEADAWKATVDSNMVKQGYDPKTAWNPSNLAATTNKQTIVTNTGNQNITTSILSQVSTYSPEQRAAALKTIVAQQAAKEAEANGWNKQQTQQYAGNLYDKVKNDPSVVGSKTSEFDNSSIPAENKSVFEYSAPNGKPYTLAQNTITGQVEFTGADGKQQTYKNYAEAKAKIDRENPTGSVNTGRNKSAAGGLYGFDKPAVDVNGDISTDNDFGDTMLGIQKDNKDENTQNVVDADEEKRARLQSLVDQTNSINAEQGTVMQNRLNNINQTFANINGFIDNLRTTANNLFDKKAQRSADARAKQLADKGYLLDDQAAAVSEYSLADYKRDTEIQKSEIEKEIATKLIELEQEKAKLIEVVNKDTAANTQQKMTQINYINQMYSSLIDDVQSKKNAINDAYTNNTTNILNAPFQTEVTASSAQKTADVTNAVTQDEVRRASVDDTARTSYIQKLVPSEYAPYVGEVVGDLISRYGVSRYLAGNLNTMVSKVSQLARMKYVDDKAAIAKATTIKK